MVRMMSGLFALLLALPAPGDEAKAKNEPKTPGAQVQALIEEYEDAYRAYAKARKEAKNFEERDRLRKELYPEPEKFAPRFFALAEKFSEDPAAVDALVWIMSNVPATARGPARDKAIDLLLGKHVQSEKLSTVCRSLSKGVDQQGEKFLRTILEKNPHAEVQGDACLALAQRLCSIAGIVRDLNQGTEAAAQHAESLDKDQLADLRKRDAARLNSDSEQLFRRFAEKHIPQMKDETLIALCVRFGFQASDSGSELLLRTLLERTSTPDVHGVACLSLGQVLKNRLNEMPSTDHKVALTLRKDCERQLELAGSLFADVKVFRTSLGERAKAELYELRHLSKGMAAPEIEAEDLDGRTFKLSDYRGKVVLLDFWGHW
jgi:hypothetical protein